MNLDHVKQIFRGYYLAIIFCLLIGLIYIAPAVYFAVNPENNYRGIVLLGAPDAEHYLVTIHAIYERGFVGNPYIKEHSISGLNNYYYLIEYFLGYTAKIFHLTIANLFTLSTFVFPVIIFLIVYFFVFQLTRQKYDSLLAAILVLLGNEMMSLNPMTILRNIMWRGDLNEFLTYSRPVNPQISSVFFFIALYAVFKVYTNPRSRTAVILCGLAIGVTAYLYFYFWAFALMLCGLLLISGLFKRDNKMFVSFLTTSVISLVVASPFLLKMFGALISVSGELAARSGVVRSYVVSHQFIFEKIIIFPILIFIGYFIYRYKFGDKRDLGGMPNRYIFLFFLLLTAFVASNQQVLTGKLIQQHHFHFFTNIPVFLIVIAIVISDFARKYFHKAAGAISIVLIIIVMSHAIGIQASSYKFLQPSYAYFQNYAAIFTWLNKNAAQNSVVAANDTLSEMTPIYTADYVYSATHAAVYPLPAERLSHNYFISLRLRGVKENEAKGYFYNKKIRDEVGMYIFGGQQWRDRCGSYGCFPDMMLDVIIEQYIIFLKNPVEQNFKQYKIDYFVWDKNREPEWRVGELKFLKPVFEYQNIVIYRVI